MKHFNLLILFLFTTLVSVAQTTLFAELSGSPVMNTSGWTLNGSAAVGDTPGDDIELNFSDDEMILTPKQYNQYGHCFFNQPINIGTCNKWRVEFEYRMYGGGGADGIAFSFLDQIPVGFIAGAGMGIPANANGLKVCFDPYFNCGGNKPEIQIFKGVGYGECEPGIIKLSNTGTTLNFLRRNYYNKVIITYDNGEVKVTVNNTLYLTGNVGSLFMTGYMGFSASTGMVDDMHSIRKVKIFADYVTSNAGADQTICSGGTAQLGIAPEANKTYNWTNTAGLSQANISNPVLTLTNTTGAPVVHEYIVQTGLTNGSSCLSNDTVRITVNPGPAATRNVSICNGNSYTIGNETLTTEGAHQVLVGNPLGCDSLITVNISFLPASMSITNAAICQGSSYTFNGQAYTNEGTYDIPIPTSPGNCDSIARLILAYTAPITSTMNETICQGGSIHFGNTSYTTAGTYLHTFRTAAGCDSTVTLNLSVSPPPTGTENAQICQNGNFVYHGQTYTNPGDYPVTIQTPAGCDSLVTLKITQVSVITASVDSTICEGDSMFLKDTYYKTTGTYNATFLSAAGCDSVVTLQLTVNSKPVRPELISNNPLNCYGDVFQAAVGNFQVYDDISWTGPEGFTSDSSAIVLVTTKQNLGTYYAVGIVNNCRSDASPVTILLSGSDLTDFEFPNVITPNGDGINEILDLNSIFNDCAEFELTIMNRWGDLVFRQKQGEDQFNGKDLHGNRLTSGVYFYKINYNAIKKSGSITVLY